MDQTSSSAPPPSIGVGDMIHIGIYDGIVWTAVSLAVMTTTLRLFSRLYVVRASGIDDLLIFFAQLLAIGSAGVARWHVHYLWSVPFHRMDTEFSSNGPPEALSESPQRASTGPPPEASLRPPGEGPPISSDPQLREFFDVLFRSSVLSDLVYLLTLPLIKCSVLAFYHRIVTLRKHRYILYITAFLIVSQALIVFFMTVFAVDPVSAVWNISSATGNPIVFSHSLLQIVNSAFQVFFDVLILTLPVPLLLKLKLRRKDRVGLTFLYLLSFFSLAATIVRLVNVVRFHSSVTELESMGQRVDYSLWAMLEIMTAIMCANLPALPALYRHYAAKSKDAYGHCSELNTRSETSRPGFRNWIYQSVYPIYPTIRNSKSRSSTQNSSTKTITNRFKAAHVEISPATADPSQNARSIDVYGHEKFDYSIDGISREVISKDLNFYNTSSTTIPPSIESYTWKPVPAPERHIYRTDEISVKSTAN